MGIHKGSTGDGDEDDVNDDDDNDDVDDDDIDESCGKRKDNDYVNNKDDNDDNDDDKHDDIDDEFIGKGSLVYKHFSRYHRHLKLFPFFVGKKPKRKKKENQGTIYFLRFSLL